MPPETVRNNDRVRAGVFCRTQTAERRMMVSGIECETGSYISDKLISYMPNPNPNPKPRVRVRVRVRVGMYYDVPTCFTLYTGGHHSAFCVLRSAFCVLRSAFCAKYPCRSGNLVPRAFSSFKMAVGETPGQGCQSGSKSSLEFRHTNTIKCLRFVWITIFDCRKQTGPPDAGNNLRKSHLIMCHVTKYSTIRGVFQQPWPGVLRPPFWTRRRPWGRGWPIGNFNIQNFCSVPVLALPDTRIISSKWRLFDTVRGRLLCIQTENLFGVVFMWRKLNIDKLGIRLDVTLQSGQSFRWRETAPGEWTNVLSGYVWTLKQDQHDLFYRVFKSRSLQHLQGERILEEIQIPPNRKIDKVSKLYESILRDYFQLDVDVESLFEQWRENDPHFAEVSEKFRGVRVLRQDPVETLFSFICSSNNSITRISGMVEKLCQAYGNKLGQINGLAYYSFPEIKQLQGSRVEECLRKMGFGYRAKFICESASFILQHHDDNWLENLRSVSYHEAHAG